MKITYIHQYFHTPDVPGSTRSYEMARRFVAWGHEVNLITADRHAPAGTPWRTSTEAGIRVHWQAVPYDNAMSVPQRIRAFTSFAAGAAQKAANLPSDIIFASSTPLTVALPAVWAAKRRRVPMVFEVRDLWPELPIAMGALKGAAPIRIALGLERFAYHNAAHIVALSPGMKAGVVRTGYPAEKVSVIPNSADIEDFAVPAAVGQRYRQANPWLGERPLIVYIGTLGQINGAGYLADLAYALKDTAPEICFAIYGGGHDEEAIRRKAETLGVWQKNFFMPGKIPKKDVPAVLSAATMGSSLFLDIQEMWHNSANKFFDTLAASKPVLINYGGWQADLLAATGAGIRLGPQDTKRAAEDLLQFLADPARVASAADAAGALARERFARDTLARNLCDVLERVAHPAQASAPQSRP